MLILVLLLKFHMEERTLLGGRGTEQPFEVGFSVEELQRLSYVFDTMTKWCCASAPICTSFAAGSSRRRLHARAERHASHAAEWKVSRVLAVSLQQTPVFSAVRGAPQSAHALPVPSGSTPPAAATSAIRRARFASAMCAARSGPLFLSLS